MTDKIVKIVGDKVYIGLIAYTIPAIQAIRNELNALFDSNNPLLLKAELEMWKRRAAHHGCNVEGFDGECG